MMYPVAVNLQIIGLRFMMHYYITDPCVSKISNSYKFYTESVIVSRECDYFSRPLRIFSSASSAVSPRVMSFMI